MKSLEGKSVVVTGAGSGIGRATAILFAEAGCKVTLADLNEAGCHETLATITAAGGIGQVIRTDVSKEADVKAMVDKAVAAYGRLDGAGNCAAVASANKPVSELSLEEWNHCISIDLTGTFLCVKHQAAAMLKTGSGSIVCVASTAAVAGLPGAVEYCAAKGGVLGLVRSASFDHSSQGVRVNAVMPGATKTPMLAAATAENGLEDQIKATTPIGRFAQPEEVGNAIRWLVSDEASFVTGSAMAVDGGYTSI